jgi:hypothetical protein
MQSGDRLGENDNWIAGFARYYGQLLISNDLGFEWFLNWAREVLSVVKLQKLDAPQR